MSKRALIFTFLGVILVGFLVFINFGKNLPLLGFFTPKFTEEIPEKRPPRLDRRDLVRFEGMKMEEVLATLLAEQETVEGATSPQPSSSPFFSSLPDHPVPFPENAIPRDEKWLRDFVTSFEKGDGSKPSEEELWQFTLALSALRISPEQLPESLREAGNPKSESDTLSITLQSIPNELAGPFVIGDFHRDGEGLEIIDQGGTRMSTLDGEGRPVPVSGSLSPFAGSQLAPADFDRDGDLDLLVLRRNGLPDSLLRNEGGGNFRDVTIELGLLAFRDSTAAAWIDYDGDGLLDLLSGSSDHPLELYHQTEGGGFQPVAWDLKLWVPRGIRQIEVGDFSGDGLSDIFLGIDSYRDRFCRTTPAETWSDWRFPEITADANLSPSEDGVVSFIDFDADGRLDIFILPPSESTAETKKLQIYHARSDGSFEEVAEAVELADYQDLRSVTPVDIDNDGFLDLFCATPELEINRLLWNRGGLAFKEISIASRASFLDAPLATEAVDFDQDGVMDLIYENESGELRWLEPQGATQDWLRISLSNARAGMRMTTEIRDKDWVVHEVTRNLRGEKQLHLGLGEADVVETISIFSADGETPLATQEKVAPNQEIRLELPLEPRKRAVAPL
ncbi:MAG: VCBS repeat-containing protein [Verrucomicrobiales bacterium]|nr:VCBS repeat-containing protein [Verrucomicrobiales bacterium]